MGEMRKVDIDDVDVPRLKGVKTVAELRARLAECTGMLTFPDGHQKPLSGLSTATDDLLAGMLPFIQVALTPVEEGQHG